MDTKQLRQAFVEFFTARDHQIVSSSPLVPANDPTLLFTNAGMVQFKQQFLGETPAKHPRAVSVQRCVRAGGKHNDLANVGYTARHHTFFEMLGNFSFGDYFKREAIQYCWQFLTEELGLPADKLWVTVYKDDDESAAIWLEEIGVDPERFSRCGDADNFWTMGDTGPCGPCTEVFYDHGPEIAGGPPGSPEQEGDRYVEIWNLVFMQYDRDAAGKQTPLPNPCVDTGMGLERLAAVMQGVTDNYDIDLFKNLLTAIELLAEKPLEPVAARVIADHIRSVAFLIMDQVRPSNEGRGYVLRRILRRAVCHGYLAGLTEPFLYRLVPALVREMGDAYPELEKSANAIADVIEREEIQFAKTLSQGMGMLEEALAAASDKQLAGAEAFKLYDTFGVPLDLILDVAHQRQVTVDEVGFEQAMQQQREASRAGQQFKLAQKIDLGIDQLTEFVGYDADQLEGCQVLGLFVDGQAVEQLAAGDEALVVLAKTPFYAEGGGQVGDCGELSGPEGSFVVSDTQKQQGVFCHAGVLASGQLAVGEIVNAQVDAQRVAVKANHSATHLLHAALRQVLGEHVVQKGSLVDAARLRLDFSHHAPLTKAEMAELERLVNAQIRADHLVQARLMSLADAKAAGAMALFDEKYGDEVRVLDMGDFSIELCGGTHVARTGEIGLFKITSETGVAAGVRRVEAVTGVGALAWVDQQLLLLNQLCQAVKTQPELLLERVNQLKQQLKTYEKASAQSVKQDSKAQCQALIEAATPVAGLNLIAAEIQGADSAQLRMMVDTIKQQLANAVVVLASVSAGRVHLIAGVAKSAVERIQAGALLNAVAKPLGGSGGGRPDMAQGAGKDPSGLSDALAAVPGWLSERLAGD